MLHNGELVVCSQERRAVSKANSFSKLNQIVVIMSLMCFYAACNGKGWTRQGGEEKGVKQYQHYTKPASPQEALQWKVILKCIIMGNLLNPNY